MGPGNMPRVIVTICLVTMAVQSAAALPAADTSAPEEAFDLGLPGVHAPELEEMARRPDRPAWAPLPILWGHSEMVPLLMGYLQDGDVQNRIRAAFLLGPIGHATAREALRRATINDDCRDVRIQAGIALACLGDPRGQKAAAAALIGEPGWIRYYAVLGLSRPNSDLARQTLEQMQPLPPDFVRRTIAAALTEPAPVLPAGPGQERARIEPQQLPWLWDEIVEAYSAECDWWWHTGNYDQCVRCMEVILLMNPAMPETYSDIAWLQWSMGYNTEAIGTYHRAIQRLPESARAHHCLGLHYYMLKKYRQAIPYLRQAVKLAPDIISRHLLAHCLERLGDLQGCFAQWKYMYEQTPQDAAVQLNYRRVQRLLDEQ